MVKQHKFIGLVLGVFIGMSLMADSRVPSPWHMVMDDQHLPLHMQDMSSDVRQPITDMDLLLIGGRHIPIRTPRGKTVTQREFEVVAGFSDSDFLVNDDTTGGCTQQSPSIAMDNAGNFVICWNDWRNGNNDIYAQRFDASFNPQDTAFRVNDDAVFCSHMSPSVAMDASGNFVICWSDPRTGGATEDYNIYAQMYDAAGTPLGTNFVVNDDVGRNRQHAPQIGMNASGNFVICWHDYRTGNPDIYAQMYDAAGNPIGVNFRVDDDPGTSHQYYPVAAMDQAGNFVISWHDYRNGNYDIYAQMYDAAGNPIGVNFRVDDDPGTNYQFSPSVAMDAPGNFVISWYDYRNGNYDIYVQMYDAAGNPIGVNFKVNDDATTEGQQSSSIAMDNAGNFVICWEDARNIDTDIYAQMYDTLGNPVGANFRANDDVGISEQWYPSVAVDSAGGRFVILWTDLRDPDGNAEIMAQLYENGNPVDVNVQINDPDPFPYCHQYSWKSSAACNSDTLVFAWQDNRRHKGWDIYGKLLAWDFPGIEEDGHREVSGFNLRAYPNPFRSCITIYGADNELEIYDVSGRLVGRTENGIWNGKDMNGREVESGVYFLKTERVEGRGYKALKVIKLR